MRILRTGRMGTVASYRRAPVGRGAAASLALALALLTATAATAQERIVVSPARVVTPEQSDVRTVTAYRIDGVDYLRLHDVARLFRCTKYWRADLEKMVLKVDGRRVKLTVGSPFVFVGDEGYQLFAPVRWNDGEIIVPASLASDVLAGLVPETVVWERDRRTLRIGTGEPNVLGLDYEVRSNGTVVEISMSTTLDGDLQFPRPNRAEVRIPGGVLAPELQGAGRALGLIDSVVCRQEGGVASLTFFLGPFGGSAELLARPAPPRLVLAVSEAGLGDDIPLPDFERPDRQIASRSVTTVVLDPGHGGSDTGVKSASGLAEKDIALNIALRTKLLLEQQEGLRVFLTRSEDRFISPEARAERANGIRPDVFVSIHCNGWFDDGLRGFSVGVPRGGDPITDYEIPRWGQRSSQTRRDTEALAESLLHQLGETLPIPNRGVRSAPYAVLEGTVVPAVHVECGFLTNRGDAALLVDPEFQETVAVALTEGVSDYRRFLESGSVRSP